MRVSKFAIVLILTFTLIASFTGGYIVTRLYSKNEESQNVKPVAEAANLTSDQDLINSNTKIVKRLTYSKNGTSFSKESNERAGSDVLGMDKVTAQNYFKQSGFNILEFTPKLVLITKEINSWPPECFVIKGNGDFITLYEVDESGNLKLKENTDIKLENLPEEDRKELEAGKIFESLDEVYSLLEEYSS